MTISAGIDVGTGCVKTVLFEATDGDHRWLAKLIERVPAEAGAIGAAIWGAFRHDDLFLKPPASAALP